MHHGNPIHAHVERFCLVLSSFYPSVNHIGPKNCNDVVMRSRIGLLVGWMLVTLTAVGVTSAAVDSVRANVTDPVAPAFVLQNEDDITRADISASPDLAIDTVSTSTTVADPDLETFQPPAPEDTTSTTSSVPATGTTETNTTKPPSTSPSTTSTTTTTAPGSVVKTYTVIGGSVTVKGSNGEVTLLGAVPKSGFSAKEEERSDPSKVVVEFESSSHKSTIEIRWRNGELTPEIDEDVQD